MISFIVPAHNEQACLPRPRTLAAIHEAARVVGGAYEVIVVDDASTDAMVEIARQSNARVVSVNHRQIAQWMIRFTIVSLGGFASWVLAGQGFVAAPARWDCISRAP